MNQSTIARIEDMAEGISADVPGQVSLSAVRKNLREALSESLPPKACDHICELAVFSLSIDVRLKKEGPGALLRALDGVDDPVWSPFYSEMVRRLEGVNEVPADVSAALQIMWGLCFFLSLWLESIDREKATPAAQMRAIRDSVSFLFAVENDQACPGKSVARLLSKSFQESGCATKVDFIEKAFGENRPHIRDVHKFFAGTEIPTFHQTKLMLQASSLGNADNSKEDDFPVMAVQFIARSYRHLSERMDIPLMDEHMPHAILFDNLRSATQARQDAEPAPMNYGG